MTQQTALILWALLAFQIKHFICDFTLQTQSQVQNKGIYGHVSGLSHAAFHALASVPALLILTSNWPTVAAFMVAEFVIHYHCDWAKAQADRVFRLSVQGNAYWIFFGLDQLIHQLTYLGIVFVMLREGWLRV